MEPPEGCPPLAGWKGHACHSPPRPVFCPDRPRPLDPGRTAEPLYTVLEQIGAQGLPGRGTRGGVADPSPVRQPAGSSRRMPRFGASREDPRKAPCAYPFGLGPNGCCHKTPLHSARPGRASQLTGESAPRWGSFCAAAQHLTFLRCVPQAAEDARSRPGGRLVFCLCKKQDKKHT